MSVADRRDDATDDFVTAGGETAFDRLTFRALDGTNRTDTWLSNEAEVTDPSDLQRQVPSTPEAFDLETDPWDPDTDDDGLTDGQEIKYTTVQRIEASGPFFGDQQYVVRRDRSVPDGLNATNPDTDGDGYWDGWIGVYNVSYDHGRGIKHADNVILYRYNLRDRNTEASSGIREEEIVSEQIRIHDVEPSQPGTDIDHDGNPEHSNLHIGELHWNTDPRSPRDEEKPNPGQTFEIDYYKYANTNAVNNGEWRDNVKQNFALYGITINFADVNTFDDEDIQDHNSEDIFDMDVDSSNGFKKVETRALTNYLDSIKEGENIIIVNESQPSLAGGDPFSGYHPAEVPWHFTDWVGLYGAGRSALECQGQHTADQLNARRILMEEIGHDWSIGKLDDDNGEVYSGSPNDETPEFVEMTGFDCDSGSITGSDTIETWSVMSQRSGGWKRYYAPEIDAEYIPYSIEELLSIDIK